MVTLNATHRRLGTPAALTTEGSPGPGGAEVRMPETNAKEGRTVLLEMRLGRTGFSRFHRDVLKDSSLTHTLHHARVTLDGAWVKVTLSGTAMRIMRIVREWKDSIVAFTHLPKAVA
jgi:hypothetical protein